MLTAFLKQGLTIAIEAALLALLTPLLICIALTVRRPVPRLGVFPPYSPGI